MSQHKVESAQDPAATPPSEVTVPMPESPHWVLSFLTAAELADAFEIAETTVNRMARDGSGPKYVRLPGIKGRIYRVEDIKEWMASNVFESQADEAAQKAQR